MPYCSLEVVVASLWDGPDDPCLLAFAPLCSALPSCGRAGLSGSRIWHRWKHSTSETWLWKTVASTWVLSVTGHLLQGKPAAVSKIPTERPAWWGTEACREQQDWFWMWILQHQVSFQMTITVSLSALSQKILSHNDPARGCQIPDAQKLFDNQWLYGSEQWLMHTEHVIKTSCLYHLPPASRHFHICQAHCWCHHIVLQNSPCQWMERWLFLLLSLPHRQRFLRWLLCEERWQCVW